MKNLRGFKASSFRQAGLVVETVRAERNLPLLTEHPNILAPTQTFENMTTCSEVLCLIWSLLRQDIASQQRFDRPVRGPSQRRNPRRQTLNSDPKALKALCWSTAKKKTSIETDDPKAKNPKPETLNPKAPDLSDSGSGHLPFGRCLCRAVAHPSTGRCT